EGSEAHGSADARVQERQRAARVRPDRRLMATECGICRTDRPAAPGGVIHADGTWRVEHIAAPIPLLGWLVIAPSRHVTTVADLTSDEAARFGVLAQHVSQALTAALRPTR